MKTLKSKCSQFLCFLFLFPVLLSARKVHIVLNSHLDLTWIFNSQELYYGDAYPPSYCAKCLFNDLIDLLPLNPSRTFTISELFFLLKYYEEALNEDPSRSQRFKKLIQRKQIIIGQGGLSIFDQATTYYDDIIDQMGFGIRKVWDLFGIKLEHAWALDVFGQSFGNVCILRSFGIKSLIFDRLSDNERRRRASDSMFLEFFWGSQGFLTHILPHNYGDDSNAYRDRGDFKSLIESATEKYKQQEDLMLVFTDDFKRWQESDFERLEEHMDFFKSMKHYDLDIFYSSPEYYFESIMKQKEKKNLEEELKEGFTDFLPLVGPNEKPWVGFYSTRPNLKREIRRFGIISRSIKNMLAAMLVFGWNGFEKTLKTCVDDMEKELGYILHHDISAGTITSKANMFVINSVKEAENNCKKELENMFPSEFLCVSSLGEINTCIFDYFKKNAMIEDQFINGSQNITVSVFNPMGKKEEVITFRIPDLGMIVRQSDGALLKSDLFCEVLKENECYLYVQTDLPGFQSKDITLSYDSQRQINRDMSEIDEEKGVEIDLNFGSQAKISIEPNFSSFSYKNQLYFQTYNIDYRYYESRRALKCPFFDNNGEYIYSCPDESGTYTRHGYAGAYVMRVESSEPINFKQEMGVKGYFYMTNFFTRVIISYNNGSIVCKQTFYEHLNRKASQKTLIINVETLINDDLRLDFTKESGREIVLAVRSQGLENKGVFFTDSNGLFPIKRLRSNTSNSGIENNFYPVVSEISINNWGEDTQKELKMRFTEISKKDKYELKMSQNDIKIQMSNEISNNKATTESQMTQHSENSNNNHEEKELKVLNDRAQGGTSLREGEIELLIARYYNTDDSLGLKEPFTTQEKTLMNHKIILGGLKKQQRSREDIRNTQKNNLGYVISIGNRAGFGLTTTNFSSVFSDLPDYVKIIMVPLENGDIVIRVQDVFNEGREESLDSLKKITEKMSKICQIDSEDGANNGCVAFNCKRTLLDGLNEENNEGGDGCSYDILTLRCEKEKKEVFKKAGNSLLFMKKTKLL